MDMFKLEPSKTYINTWNSFSRVLLIWENIKSKNLAVFDTKEELVKFSKIWEFSFGYSPNHIEELEEFIWFLCEEGWMFLVTKELFSKSWMNRYEMEKNTLKLKRWEKFDFDAAVKMLIDFDWRYSAHLSQRWTYNKEWDIINISTYFNGNTAKISFFWDEIDEILIIDSHDAWKIRKLDSITLHNLNLSSFESKKTIMDNLDDMMSKAKSRFNTYLIWIDFWESKDEFNNITDSTVLTNLPQNDAIDVWIGTPGISSVQELLIMLWDKKSEKTIYTKNKRTLTNFIEYNNIESDIKIVEIPEKMRYLESFKVWNKICICDDILSDIFIRKRSKKSVAKSFDLLLEIRPWDYIVHIDHWIWIFKQIILKDLSWMKREYIEIEYRENDKLFVPISELHRVSKYIWEDGPKLSRLNSTEWQKIIKSTEVEVEKIAKELLEIYAKRAMVSWYAFYSDDKKEHLFKSSFPYKYTFDQENAIKEILSDMELVKPMDRLLVWDVWFGKTEVAMNAIYRSFINWKQSAFISPLVILAYEHYDSLCKRFADFGVRVEVMSRITSAKEEKSILDRLKRWEVDCIIWTHRLLSEDVKFKNLWLVVIDEEHRFWVMDKEKLNKMRANIDILSLSATPIPRSLNFALNWIKDISIISTPPPKKQPIKTIVSKWNDEQISQAIRKEFERWWQVLFIHNRVATIESVKHYLERLLGKKTRIAITHWQMNWIEVENRIIDFKNQKYDILLSTTVIENGVNFYNANTIIIDEADTFWLSQLHQLRWRVWRWSTEGHCYLVYRKENVPDDAKKRLITIVNNTHLWAWFEIAMRDLEIRWAGDILWIKQSWKSKETWISLYLKLLEDKVEELKTWEKRVNLNCQIELNISYYISEDFFSSEADKLHFFRNIESIETLEDLDFAYKTFIEWNDKLPQEFENLFILLKTRIILSPYWVNSLKKVWQSYIFEFDKNTSVEKIREFLDTFDRWRDFALITVHKMKVETKMFKNDLEFLKDILKTI
ncbi:MAG: Transcription-repair coupling factor [uncultured bacterium (gcode 4)]|uniref:Transcription-repair coupling factor n=1 Tax=uncultured bacterium (gcode 4) TaxID=1234023 RepID=K2G1U8_9BACT|nr:MAG: Transcription-repair coupling factor [uncultured bacterium (gcode 4)]